MATFLIPLQNLPQQFAISLGGKEYSVISRWNDALEGGWVLDFSDAITGEAIVSNVPLITGADCLAGLEYLEFNGRLIVYTDGDQFAVPTLLDLGVESNLYFQTDLSDE